MFRSYEAGRYYCVHSTKIYIDGGSEIIKTPHNRPIEQQVLLALRLPYKIFQKPNGRPTLYFHNHQICRLLRSLAYNYMDLLQRIASVWSRNN